MRTVTDSKEGERSPVQRKANGRRFKGRRRVVGSKEGERSPRSRRVAGSKECEGSSIRFGVGIGDLECLFATAS